MERRVIVRKPLAFLDWENLPPPLQRRIFRLEAQAEDVGSAAAGITLADVKAGLASFPWNEHVGQLSHPLSARWLSRRVGTKIRDERCPTTELDGYLGVRSALVDSLTTGGAEAFLAAAQASCASFIRKKAVDCRQTPIGLEPDFDGTLVQFGEWQHVPARLLHLHREFTTSNLPVTMKAVSALAVFLNVHPFVDGNGRTARALFNAALESASGSMLGYLPLRAIFDASLGGFEIRLREAETNQNWAPLVEYFTSVFAIQERSYSKISRSLVQ